MEGFKEVMKLVGTLVAGGVQMAIGVVNFVGGFKTVKDKFFPKK